MSVTTVSSRDFNQDIGKAKKASARGPVFITDRGKPAHVLLSIEEYRRLRGQRVMSLSEALAQKPEEEDDFEFEAPKLNPGLKPAEFD